MGTLTSQVNGHIGSGGSAVENISLDYSTQDTGQEEK